MNDENSKSEAQNPQSSGYPLDWNTTDVRLAKGRFVHTLRRPTEELILARETEVQVDIQIGKDGSYRLPDPTQTEAVDAKYYDQICEKAEGYGDRAVPTVHKAAAFQGLYVREIYVAEDADIFADEVPVIEEFGSGDDPEFTITHWMRQPAEDELKRLRKLVNSGEVRPGKRGTQRYLTSSNLKRVMLAYGQMLIRIDGATLRGAEFSDDRRNEFIGYVDGLVQQRVVIAMINAVAGGLLD